MDAPSTSSQISEPQMEESETQQFDNFSNVDTQSFAGSYGESDSMAGPFSPSPFSPGSVSQASKKRKASHMNETNEILREYLASRPKPSDFIQKPADELEQFFHSMSLTVRKFSPLAIARIKMKVAQLIGEEELLWAENAARLESQNVEFIYVPADAQPAETGQQQIEKPADDEHPME